MSWASRLGRRLFVLPLVIYQAAISPLLPHSCRFFPSCSEYARQAILKHGPCRGSLLAIKRFLRCHPLSRGGYDPVP
ncbi:MAG: membrane protein insertion efficiency factor YidD [Candidatus Acetothermia bacterium]|nr:membrane protein insertion efficiency factor YidD [Candidatus Acetothermia bacterium]MDH7505906.1 membrane protein insertion efficiency factor YidD [Candidatus Acetothermia bacterium]